MRGTLTLVVLAAFLAYSHADVYLHSPRGQNDRCDEKSNDRNNEQRCWNSNNNAAGGYGICDKEMVFYTGTQLNIEWYSQHNCGNGAQLKTNPYNPEGVHCNIILQLGCDFAMSQFQYTNGQTYNLSDGLSLGRPGADQYNTATPVTTGTTNGNTVFDTFGDTCTETAPTTATCTSTGTASTGGGTAVTDPTNPCNANLNTQGTGTFNSATCQCHPRKMQTYCSHEPEAFWLKCHARQRNKGLFAADQSVNNNAGATNTRQEPNSARYGFECPEEVDYWPYWHPTPWIDLAVFTNDLTQCNFYQTQSQNVMSKCECVAPAGSSATVQQEAWMYNQEVTCTQASTTGSPFIWNCTGNAWNWPAPACLLSASQPDNSLGRIDNGGDNTDSVASATLANYQWNIPTTAIPTGLNQIRCSIRLRYNISTAEVPSSYDVSNDYMLSDNPVYTYGNGSGSAPVTSSMPLRLAINTAQYGRTFQDRTYTFTIAQRPSSLAGKNIINVNARGKRGNIAQVRNCFEYDFVPIVVQANLGDVIYFQWCLTDYNNNGNAGNGRNGMDRVNVVPLPTYDKNIYSSLNTTTTIFSTTDLAQLAWLGQNPATCYSTTTSLTTAADNDQDPYSCHFLNGVYDSNGMPTAYFSYFATVTSTGTFQFMSSRNNDFSNRSNKATINVGIPNMSAGAIAGTVIGTVAGVAAVGAAGFFVVKKKGLMSFSSRV